MLLEPSRSSSWARLLATGLLLLLGLTQQVAGSDRGSIATTTTTTTTTTTRLPAFPINEGEPIALAATPADLADADGRAIAAPDNGEPLMTTVSNFAPVIHARRLIISKRDVVWPKVKKIERTKKAMKKVVKNLKKAGINYAVVTAKNTALGIKLRG